MRATHAHAMEFETVVRSLERRQLDWRRPWRQAEATVDFR
jgi:hypothetical protein